MQLTQKEQSELTEVTEPVVLAMSAEQFLQLEHENEALKLRNNDLVNLLLEVSGELILALNRVNAKEASINALITEQIKGAIKFNEEIGELQLKVKQQAAQINIMRQHSWANLDEKEAAFETDERFASPEAADLYITEAKYQRDHFGRKGEHNYVNRMIERVQEYRDKLPC